MNANTGISIAFLGDIILNSGYINLWKNKINPFEEVGEYLSQFDFVVGNLECIAGGSEGTNPLRQSILETDVDTLGFLQQINVNVVTLAHNHVYDHKESGFINTVNKLEDLDIQYFGASLNLSKKYEPLILEKNGIKVGLLNYVTEDTNPNIPEDAQVYVNWFGIKRICSDIKNIKSKVDHVVILPHWGGKTEYSMLPHVEQIELAKQLIEAGADLIVGHHSHTIQPHQKVLEKDVFYSLGNFCMDMNLYNYRKKRMSKSLLVSTEFGKQGYSTKAFRLKNKGKMIDVIEEFILNESTYQFHNNYLRFHNFMHIKYEKWINKLTHNVFKILQG